MLPFEEVIAGVFPLALLSQLFGCSLCVFFGFLLLVIFDVI